MKNNIEGERRPSGYDVGREYVNIENYSPFWFLNEVSPQYHKSPFDLRFVSRDSKSVPVHPDTFSDLGLAESEVISRKLVYPTSSFRSVYSPEENVCYKVPLLRRITRSIRDLQDKQLQRSERATELLSQVNRDGFKFLKEKCFYAGDPNFNFIKREMPSVDVFPWFYVIKSGEFDQEFEMGCISNMIKIWMSLAAKNILLEAHTQNLLVDKNRNVYYRDLSDVRSVGDPLLQPSYAPNVNGSGDILATIFDRTMCAQNIDHLFRYDTKLQGREKELKDLIKSEIEKNKLPFPPYSMDYPKDKPILVPERTEITFWRK